MAFPENPSDQEVYLNYRWNEALGAWEKIIFTADGDPTTTGATFIEFNPTGLDYVDSSSTNVQLAITDLDSEIDNLSSAIGSVGDNDITSVDFNSTDGNLTLTKADSSTVFYDLKFDLDTLYLSVDENVSGASITSGTLTLTKVGTTDLTVDLTTDLDTLYLSVDENVSGVSITSGTLTLTKAGVTDLTVDLTTDLDDIYYTQTSLNSTTSSSGATLIGVNEIRDNTTVQSVLEKIDEDLVLVEGGFDNLKIPTTSGAPEDTPDANTVRFDPVSGMLYIFDGTDWREIELTVVV